MKRWIIAAAPPQAYRKKFSNYSRFIQAILYARGIKTKREANDFFELRYEAGLNDPFLLTDMKKAVNRIGDAVKKKEKIAIYGDYDADGVTATTIINRTMLELGMRPVIYIPDRAKEGYGLNGKAVGYLAKKGVNLIITVDTGIRNFSEVELCGKQGIDVVVTDHHTVPDKLPRAAAVVNPQRDKRYPFRELSGAGVAFKLAQALIATFGSSKFSVGFEKWLLDLVAIGTIADIVPLIRENRTLTKYGLIVVAKTRRAGLRALMDKAGIPLAKKPVVTSEHVAFQIAPRINAAGRMDHANSAFMLLNTEDEKEAEKIADGLAVQNRKRQDLTKKIFDEIEALVADAGDKRIIIAGKKAWPVGLVGLVAGRVCDKYSRPTLVYTEEGDQIRGSARSIPEFHVTQALEQLDRLLLEYGGHRQAAGFTLLKKDLPEFQLEMERIAQKKIKKKYLIPKLRIDYEISFAEISDQLVNDLKALEPFGAGNEEPVFLVRKAYVSSVRLVGNGQKHLKLTVCQEKERSRYYGCIGFNIGEFAGSVKQGDLVDIAFNMYVNAFNGSEYLELRIIDIKKHGS